MKANIFIPGNTIAIKQSLMAGEIQGGYVSQPTLVLTPEYQTWLFGANSALKDHPLIGTRWRYPVKIDFFFLREDPNFFQPHMMVHGPIDVCTQVGILDQDQLILIGQVGFVVNRDKPGIILQIKDGVRLFKLRKDFRFYLGGDDG